MTTNHLPKPNFPHQTAPTVQSSPTVSNLLCTSNWAVSTGSSLAELGRHFLWDTMDCQIDFPDLWSFPCARPQSSVNGNDRLYHVLCFKRDLSAGSLLKKSERPEYPTCCLQLDLQKCGEYQWCLIPFLFPPGLHVIWLSVSYKLHVLRVRFLFLKSMPENAQPLLPFRFLIFSLQATKYFNLGDI